MPNRKERRAQRARERRGLGGLPESVTSTPAFKAGLKAKDFPPEYYAEIENAARLISQWYHAEPTRPDLRWVQQKNDGVFIAASLIDGAKYLADSPDAFRLLAWLDDETGRKLSLNQCIWALRRCRALPMPDGSFYGVETVLETKAQKSLRTFARDAGKEDTRNPPSPCGHCGQMLDSATGSETGMRAKPGDLSICIKCLGVNRFDADLRNVAVTADQLAEAPPELRAHLEEMQALFRHAQFEMATRPKGARKPEVEA